MRNILSGVVLSVVSVAAFCPSVFAQSVNNPPKEAGSDAATAHNLDGIWVTKHETNGAALLDQHLRPPFTPWGQARFDESVPSIGPRDIPGKENDPNLYCYPDGIPKILTSPEPFQIVTSKKQVLMLFEKDHGWRQIFTDGRKLPEDALPTYDGYSVGHWQDDTLVVQSAGFNDKVWLDYLGDPRSDALRLTEYYRRVDARTLSISVTIDDPKAYTKPWVGKPKLYVLKPEWEIMEWYCTPDNITEFDKSVRIPSGQPAPDQK